MDLKVEEISASLKSSECLLVAAGAGIGVDSGLPDFRGHEGFWNAYPPLAKLGVRFEDCLLYTSPSPRDRTRSRMPSSA